VNNTAILAEGLERRFGSVEAVRGVDLQIRSGEIYGFLGPNGAGKSTCVRMLTTLLRPSGGRAVVAGHDVSTDADAVRLRIGVALQEASLDPKQTGRELLLLQARLYGLTSSEARGRLEEMSRLVDIGDALDRRVGTYSGGMTRRLDLAVALVHNPTVLFLDEPTTGLDPASRAKVWEEVRHVNEELGMTVFLTTQYLEEADELADRVGIIADGRLVAEGTPEELKRRIGDDVIKVSVGSDPDRAREVVVALGVVSSVEVDGATLMLVVEDGAASVGPVAVALAGADVDVRDISVHRPTLDDVFLELTGAHL
jgi:ABC-2 type transport system ATP-binding protein